MSHQTSTRSPWISSLYLRTICCRPKKKPATPASLIFESNIWKMIPSWLDAAPVERQLLMARSPAPPLTLASTRVCLCFPVLPMLPMLPMLLMARTPAPPLTLASTRVSPLPVFSCLATAVSPCFSSACVFLTPQCQSLIFYCILLFSPVSYSEDNIAKIANAVQVTICLLVSTSVY